MRIISSDPLKLTNPKCKISTEIVNDGTNPGIEIAFGKFAPLDDASSIPFRLIPIFHLHLS